ncbi:MAG: protein-disulfide reductase DsbD [Halioglobus sp.]
MRALLATVLLLASSLCLAQGLTSDAAAAPFGNLSNQAEFLPVEQAYQLNVEIESDQRLRLYWQIEDSYYLYQHRFNFSLTDSEGKIDLDVTLPPALERTDEYFGEVSVYYHDANLSIVTSRPVAQAMLVVTSQGCADAGLCYPPYTEYFEVDFVSGTVTATDRPQTAGPSASGDSTTVGAGKLLYMLLLAFLGGSILNLMPCVFPVLSLKMLSFARSSDNHQHAHSWVYAAGVIISFIVVAAVLIALQNAGQAVGWGFHLQSPSFVIAMAYLFVAMALSLSGLINFGSSIMGTGNELASRDGLSGSFFTGVLAVIVASPCTAPFMGTALGFAVTQPAPLALSIFAALGAGMAAPMVALNYSSGLRSVMPKPGPWMETLKQFLAFPLYATAIWLFWVAGRQTGVNTMAIALLGALMIGLGLWLWRYKGWRKGLALVCIASAIGLGNWRALDESPANPLPGRHTAWSEQAMEQLRSAGKPVFVDVTADWCISCIANEQGVLLTDEVTDAFAQGGITYMVADWTNYDADIATFLKQHGRNGIPFYIFYPGDSNQPPLILPQILTKSIVLNAIEEVNSKNGILAATLE